MTKPNAKLTDLTLDTANLNAHTERGTYMTRNSIEKFGGILAGVIDKNNRVIDANLRTEIYAEKGIEDIVIIDADPNVPMYLRFDHLDLTDNDNPARELQLALQISGYKSFNIDPENLAIHLMANGELAKDWFFDSELQDILSVLENDIETNFNNDSEASEDNENACKCCGRLL